MPPSRRRDWGINPIWTKFLSPTSDPRDQNHRGVLTSLAELHAVHGHVFGFQSALQEVRKWKAEIGPAGWQVIEYQI